MAKQKKGHAGRGSAPVLDDALWQRLVAARELSDALAAWAEALEVAPEGVLTAAGEALARADAAEWLLELSRSGVRSLELVAIEGLSRRPTDAGIARLTELAEAPVVAKDVHRAARRALHRLRSGGIAIATTPHQAASPARPATAPATEYHLADGRLSGVDFTGTQAVEFTVSRPAGDALLVEALVSFTRGLHRCNVGEMSRRRARELTEQRRRAPQDLEMFPCPAEYALWRLREGVSTSRQAARGLPPDYLLYVKDFDHCETPYDRPLIYQLLNDPEPRAAIPTRDRLDNLLNAFPVSQWSIGNEELKDVAHEIRQIEQSRIVLSPSARQDRVEQLRRRAWDRVLTDEQLHNLQRMLEEIAAFYRARSQNELARTAVESALALAPDSGIPVRRNPMALALVDRGLGLDPRDVPAPDVDPTTGYRRMGGAVLLD